MTDNPEEVTESNDQEKCSLAHSIARLPQLVNKDDVERMINVQVTAIDRIESTNKSLANCSNSAQNKLATTTRLFKRTAKHMSEAKKDLDVIYKKIVELKGKIRADRPDLFQNEDDPPKSTPLSQPDDSKDQDPSSDPEGSLDVVDKDRETAAPER